MYKWTTLPYTRNWHIVNQLLQQKKKPNRTMESKDCSSATQSEAFAFSSGNMFPRLTVEMFVRSYMVVYFLGLVVFLFPQNWNYGRNLVFLVRCERDLLNLWLSLLFGSCSQFSVCNFIGVGDLQCCVSFRWTTKWFTYTYTNISSFSDFFLYRLLQNTEQNSLCYTVGPYWLYILCVVVCIW